jgi:hypothetical protein
MNMRKNNQFHFILVAFLDYLTQMFFTRGIYQNGILAIRYQITVIRSAFDSDYFAHPCTPSITLL